MNNPKMENLKPRKPSFLAATQSSAHGARLHRRGRSGSRCAPSKPSGPLSRPVLTARRPRAVQPEARQAAPTPTPGAIGALVPYSTRGRSPRPARSGLLRWGSGRYRARRALRRRPGWPGGDGRRPAPARTPASNRSRRRPPPPSATRSSPAPPAPLSGEGSPQVATSDGHTWLY